jgi:hypothetical protein
MEELKKILSPANKPIDNNDLKNYLNGTLTNEQQHELESNLSDEDPFVQDAIEGLKENNNSNIDFTIYEINKSVEKKLLQKKKKEKRKLNTGNLTIIAIFLILLLAIIGFIVIKMVQ